MIRRVAIRTASDDPRETGYYLFHDLNVDEIFKFSSQQKGEDLFKKFSL